MEEDQEGGDDGRLALRPPTEYRRMLSWQLSQLQPAPVTSTRRAQKERERRRKRSSNAEGDDIQSSEDIAGEKEEEEEEEEDAEERGEEGGFAYLVVNSNGEEECYYSAPESPPVSEDDGDGEGGGEGGGGEEEVCLPPQERKRGGRSKKAKKKFRSVTRLAEVEFFGPLCDLVEGSLEVDVGGVEVADRVDVPSLAELCVRSIHRARLRLKCSPDPQTEDEPPLHLPYLIHALVGAHRAQRSLVGLQVRWLERFLAAWETESGNPDRVPCSEIFCDLSPPLAFCPRLLWDTSNVGIVPDPFRGPHLPLPHVSPTNMDVAMPQDGWNDMTTSTCLEFSRHVSSLVHFANFLYPLFTLRGSGHPGNEDQSLLPSQTSAIARVNSFLSSRYKVLCEDHREFLKLWPGYVYWARGQVKLALSAFSTALKSLKYGIDRAIALNEMGRMMLMFGDRYNAALFFTKTQEVDPLTNQFNKFFKPSKEAVQPHVLSLQASAWDCGLLTRGTARQAAGAWSRVLTSSAYLVGSWYLSLAAVESRMMIHSGVPVGSHPASPLSTNTDGESPMRQWLCELLDQLSSLVTSHPLLYYHYSLLLAVDARLDEARRTFLMFCDNYLLFREWSEGSGFPGDPFSTQTNRRLLNPWLPLCNMLNEQGLPHAPIMKLKWRTRLLYPMYPYSKTEEVNYLADHCSSTVNLRLSESGQLTADLHMDLPPMRSVLLDPYSGSVCFSRSASLHHHLSGPVGNMGQNEFIVPDEMAMPWPLRLLELGDGAAVELVMSGCVDPEIRHYSVTEPCRTNHSLLLRWYCGSQHCQLDLRLAIRRHLKEAVLEFFQESIEQVEKEEQALLANMKEDDATAQQKLHNLQTKREDHAKRAELVTPTMERGFSFSVEDFCDGAVKVPSKYIVTKRTGKSRAKTKFPGEQKPRRKRDTYVTEFNLTLTEYFVYGEATLALFFTVTPRFGNKSTNQFYRQALVLVNCRSRESFLRPVIHCAADARGFLNVYPSNEVATLYPSRHLPHISHLAMFKHDQRLQTCTRLLLDQRGHVVYRQEHDDVSSFYERRGGFSLFVIPEHVYKFKFSLGDRVFMWSRSKGVCSYNLKMKDRVTIDASVTTGDVVTVVPVPGCLLLQTADGLNLIHPGSLKLLKLDHAKKVDEETNESPYEHHFLAIGSTLCVVSVFSVEGCERELCLAGGDVKDGGEREGGEGEEEQTTEERREELSRLDFGSCCVALTLNSRLLVLQLPHKSEVVRVLIDVVLPGRVTEFHDMGGSLGYMVSATLFPDCFREELYWLSSSGKLRGMLPCLGAGRHSFLSLTLPPPPTPTPSPGTQGTREEEREEGGRQCLFFNDGQGGICCLQLDT